MEAEVVIDKKGETLEEAKTETHCDFTVQRWRH